MTPTDALIEKTARAELAINAIGQWIQICMEPASPQPLRNELRKLAVQCLADAIDARAAYEAEHEEDGK